MPVDEDEERLTRHSGRAAIATSRSPWIQKHSLNHALPIRSSRRSPIDASSPSTPVCVRAWNAPNAVEPRSRARTRSPRLRRAPSTRRTGPCALENVPRRHVAHGPARCRGSPRAWLRPLSLNCQYHLICGLALYLCTTAKVSRGVALESASLSRPLRVAVSA